MISFPVPLADFFDGLQITQLSFEPGDSSETSGTTSGGEIQRADTGNDLWFGSVQIAPAEPRYQGKIRAKLSVLSGANASFMIADTTNENLANDPDGSISQANSPTIESAEANGFELTLQGMPDLFVLEEDDRFSVDHGDGTFSYYTIVKGGVFSDAVYTPARSTIIEVRPELSEKIVGGLAVTFHRPALKAVLEPNSISGGTHKPALSDGISFSWRQTLG